MFNLTTLLWGLLAFAIVRGNRIWYARKVKALRVPRRPLAHQLLAGGGAVVAVFTLTRSLDVIGFLLAAVALIAGIRFIYTTLSSRLPGKQIAVRRGQPALNFTALDGHGEPFTLSSLSGRPILIKFFRGHW
ncbi:MAG: hypothetical protein Fur0021_30870 [Candidatus Promineifilaceae bacterium]